MSISGWMADAECLQYDPELFFSGGAGGAGGYEDARRVCAACHVTAECLAHVLAIEAPTRRHGLWAGLTPVERGQLARAEGIRPRRVCPVCRTAWRPRTASAVYCSAPCRMAALRERRRAGL